MPEFTVAGCSLVHVLTGVKMQTHKAQAIDWSMAVQHESSEERLRCYD
jgi:hypothetical protein